MKAEEVRAIIREELAAFFGPQQSLVDTQLDAEHMARMIVEGRGAEVKKLQHLRLTGRAA